MESKYDVFHYLYLEKSLLFRMWGRSTSLLLGRFGWKLVVQPDHGIEWIRKTVVSSSTRRLELTFRLDIVPNACPWSERTEARGFASGKQIFMFLDWFYKHKYVDQNDMLTDSDLFRCLIRIKLLLPLSLLLRSRLRWIQWFLLNFSRVKWFLFDRRCRDGSIERNIRIRRRWRVVQKLFLDFGFDFDFLSVRETSDYTEIFS